LWRLLCERVCVVFRSVSLKSSKRPQIADADAHNKQSATPRCRSPLDFAQRSFCRHCFSGAPSVVAGASVVLQAGYLDNQGTPRQK